MAITVEKNKSGCLGLLIVGVLVVGLVVGSWFGLRQLFGFRTPPQPVYGYTGDWKLHMQNNGEQERPLPSATNIWRYDASWQPTNTFTSRFYLARLGHAERQLNFRSFTNKGGSLGDVERTRVEFLYRDPTNGDYALNWDLPGKHDVSFLKFDDREKWFQLRLLGSPDTQPPQLEILGIEGIAPMY